MTRRIDNILAKAILFVGTMVAFAIFSYDSLLKILVIPIFTLVLSFGFGYWKQLKNHRQQIAILVYITLFIGVAAAIAKHWQFFISGIFTGQFERADLGELINDFIIFFLGFLLTYLEMEQEAKEPIQSEQNHSSTDPISIPQQPPPAGKRFSFFMPTLIGALIGAVTIIYLRFFLRVHES